MSRSGHRHHVPLSRAQLCIQCEAVFHSEDAPCPACGSRHYHPIAKWLDRAEPERAADLLYHVSRAGIEVTQ